MPTNIENSLFEAISGTDTREFNQKKAKEQSSCIQSILEKLTNDNLENINGLVEEIKKFYQDNKRHKYSDITLHLFSLQHAEQNGKIGNIEKNIEILIGKLSKNDELIKNNLLKLQDHVLLEIARLHEFSLMKEEIEKTSKEVQESKEEIEKTSKEVQESKKSYIVILGIFSSIVLSFVAGLNFSNSILSNMEKVSIYRLIFIVSFIALFIGNILHFLFTFLLKISSNTHLKINWLFIGFNFIIVAIMFIDLILYLFNIRTIDDILTTIDFFKQQPN
ncbi:MAG: hypothetical protein SPF34_04680 [Helicobacter sp.]|uniref:hypothetical protein n=1 Tax=Helicobacter sp. TaxID=218 RepID=UPI002A909D61|nr:hypothetical protein [Helicobacter sp.]MDY5616190.1 hypothetical protein [Helicobacter sp.]